MNNKRLEQMEDEWLKENDGEFFPDDYEPSPPTTAIKQVIVVRKDLNMRKGKIATQVAHAAMAVFLNKSKTKRILCPIHGDIKEFTFTVTPEGYADKWLCESFTKIVVGVETEEEFRELIQKIEDDPRDIPFAMITDNGVTEFHHEKHDTCFAIGPYDGAVLNEFTGELKLI